MDFILDHVDNDERPYLKVQVLGLTLLGLLDSGASTTILGSRGWTLVQRLNISLDTSKKIMCKVANGQTCYSNGECELPICVRNKVKLVRVLVVPDIPHVLILGTDFWRIMGIVPDLRHNEWYFSKEPFLLDSVDHLRSQTVLTSMEENRLKAVIDRNKALMGEALGCTDRTEHVIKTDSPPIKQRYYPVSPVIQQHINNELDDLLAKDIVERSTSGWSSPILLVKKKEGGYRFCVDFRKLNAVTERDGYPIPYVSHTLDKLRDAHYLSSLDIKSAYHQVPVAESSRPYTAFTVPGRGLFQWKRMPFGLHNAPATWQRLVDSILGPELEPHVFVYLDDIVIVTQTFEKHISVLEEVFRRLREAKLTISWGKCQFCRPEMKYLGFLVDRNGLHCDPEKVSAMLKLPAPTNVKEVRKIIGVFSWYRRFIPDFSTKIAPITALLRKGRKFVWTAECSEAFQTIKEFLITAPVLNCPDYDLPFELHTDASGYGLGAVLIQKKNNEDRVICFLSRSLTKQERNFSTTERECLAVLWAVEKLRPYLEGIPFTVVTDHYSLVWLQNLKDVNGRLARWTLKLQMYDFKIVHRKGKDHIVPDMLSRAVPVVDVCDTKGVDLQSSDKWYGRLVEKVQKRPLQFSNFRLANGRLYKNTKPIYKGLGSPGDTWKIVIPKAQRKALLKEAHDNPTSGHMGVYKTYHRLAEKYFWPKMKSDVSKYVRNCVECNTCKPDLKKPAGLMVAQPKVQQPFEMISMDLMGPLPRSMKGKQYILVVTDYFTKYSLIYSLKDAKTPAIVKLLEEEVFLVYGVPRLLLCDNGPQFISRAFQQLTREYQVKIRFNSNYHPQANPTERVNRTLKSMLAMYVSDNHRLWDVNLPKIACALRTAVHETTRHSPYFLNFGRRMKLSGKEYMQDGPEEVEPANVESRPKAFQGLFKEVKRRLEEAAEKNKTRYDLRRRPEEFLPNQLVWRKNYTQSDKARYYSAKLAPRYVGPFYIKKRISPWTYELRDDKGNFKGIWSAKDLKSASADENSLE